MAQIRFRFFNFSLALSLKLALIGLFFTLVQTPQVLLAKGIPQRWEPKQYQPPVGIGTPGRLAGGATRSPRSSCQESARLLRALVPSRSFGGVTVADYPTFFVFMPALSPQASPLPVEFVLEDTSRNQVYKSTFQTSGKSGILTLSLPPQGGLSPLAVGKDYKWSFSVICQPEQRSLDITVEGWVRRVELNPTLKTQLAQASPQQKVELYAEAEIWHDALATLVQLRRDKPNDAAVADNWAKLLSAAGLEDITQETLVSIPTTPERQLTSSQR
jgi:hypothetical protein